MGNSAPHYFSRENRNPEHAATIAAKLVLITALIALAAAQAPILHAAYNATQPIVINPDGSITPAGAPITTTDNVTYTLTDNIIAIGDAIVVNRSNIILDGAGFTITGPQGTNSGITLVQGLDNVTIRNLEIRNFDFGIFVDAGVNNTVIQNVTFNQSYYGIQTRYSFTADSYNLTVQDSLFLSNSLGIYIQDVNGVVIRNNVFTNFSSSGVGMQSVVSVVIDSNSFSSFPGNTAKAISSSSGINKNLTITRNTIDNVEDALHLYSLDDKGNTIALNTLTNITGTAILVGPDTPGNRLATIRDNVIQDVKTGIHPRGPDLVFSNNTVSNAEHALLLEDVLSTSTNYALYISFDQTNTFEGHPIYYIVNQTTVQLSNVVAYSVVVVNANQVELSNIQVVGDSDIGLGMRDANDIIVSNLSITTTGHGVYLRSVNNATITQSTIQKLPQTAPTTTDTVGVFPVNSNDIIVRDSTIRGFEVGAGATGTTNFRIEGNTIENGYKGIYVDRGVYGGNDNVEIIGNTIRNMTGTGINADNGITRIEGNTLYNIRAPGDGPWAIVDYVSWANRVIVIRDNIIYDSDRGIYVGGQTPRNALVENNTIYNINDYGATSGAVTYGVYVTGQDVVVRNNTVYNISGYALRVQASTNQTIDSNTARDSLYGLYIDPANANPTLIVKDNSLHNNTFNFDHRITTTTLSSYIYGIEFQGANTANGKTIVFLVNQSDQSFTGELGAVFLYDVRNITFANITIANSSVLKPFMAMLADGLTLSNALVDLENFNPQNREVTLMLLAGVNNTVLDNVELKGNATNPTVLLFRYGLKVNGAVNLTLSNLSTSGVTLGVALESTAPTKNVVATGLTISSSSDAFYVNTNLDNLTLTLSNLTSQGSEAFSAVATLSLNVGNLTLTNNTFKGASEDVELYWVENAVFRYNLFIGNYPFDITNSKNILFTENSFANSQKPPYTNLIYNSTSPLTVYFNDSSRGNYWQGYNATDSDGDGILDAPLLVQNSTGSTYPNVYDYLPLANPPVPVPPPPPGGGGAAPAPVYVPQAQVTPSSLDFGSVSVNATVTLTLVVSNTGNGTLTISSATITGAGAGAFSLQGLTTPADISPGASLTLTVAFTPTSTVGYSATLTLSTNDPNAPSITISLQGTGVTPPPTLEPEVIERLVDTLEGRRESLEQISELVAQAAGVRNVTFEDLRELDVDTLLTGVPVAPGREGMDRDGNGVIDIRDTAMTLVEYGVFRSMPPSVDREFADTLLSQLKALYGENLERFPTVEGKIWLLALYKASEES